MVGLDFVFAARRPFLSSQTLGSVHCTLCISRRVGTRAACRHLSWGMELVRFRVVGLRLNLGKGVHHLCMRSEAYFTRCATAAGGLVAHTYGSFFPSWCPTRQWKSRQQTSLHVAEMPCHHLLDLPYTVAVNTARYTLPALHGVEVSKRCSEAPCPT